MSSKTHKNPPIKVSAIYSCAGPSVENHSAVYYKQKNQILVFGGYSASLGKTTNHLHVLNLRNNK